MMNNRQIIKKADYNKCLKELLAEILYIESDVIQAVVLYGSLCREKFIIPNWTDIDIFIFYKNIWHSNSRLLQRIIEKNENRYHIRIDITRVNIEDLNNDVIQHYPYPSVISILNNTSSCFNILYGNLPEVKINTEVEKFISFRTTLMLEEQIRNIQLDNNFFSLSIMKRKKNIEKLIRLINTYLRNALVVAGVYTDPYNSLINNITNVYSVDTVILMEMCNIRKEFQDYIPDETIISKINEIIIKIKPQIKEKYEIFKSTH